MLLTVDPDQGFHERVAAGLSGTRWATAVTAVSTLTEAADVLQKGAVGLTAVLGGPSLGFEDGVVLAERAVAAVPGVAVLLVAAPTTERLRRAMRAGARDVLSPDFDSDELTAALAQAGFRTAGPTAVPGLTVAVLGVKGGVGASVLASNLAIRLADGLSRNVTVADLDLASADLAVMHGLSARWTIQDIADGTVGLDIDSLREVLQPIGDRGARLLPGPVDPALAERITAEDVTNLVTLLRAEAPLVVLDLATSFDDRTLAAIDAADMVVLTAGLDVASLRGLAVALRTLQQLGVEDHQVRVVIVRADSKAGLTLGDVERTIGRAVDVKVPSTRAVPRSVNEGVPLALSSRRSGVVQAIDELVQDVTALLPAAAPVREAEDDTGRRRFRGRGRDAEVPLASAAPPVSDVRPDQDGGHALDRAEDASAGRPQGDVPAPGGARPVRPRVVRRARTAPDGSGGEVLYLSDPGLASPVTDEHDAPPMAHDDLRSLPPPVAEGDRSTTDHHRDGGQASRS